MALYLAKQDTETTERLVQPFGLQALILIRQKHSRPFGGLHPAHPQPTTRPVHDLPLAPQWPRPCAPYPQTLPLDLLGFACSICVRQLQLEKLMPLIDLLSQGQACPVAGAAFSGAGLIALLIPGTRGGAIGMTFTPITAKSLMADLREMARKHNWQAHVGVAVASTLQFARSVDLTFNLDRYNLVCVGATLSAPQTVNFPAQLLTDTWQELRASRF